MNKNQREMPSLQPKRRGLRQLVSWLVSRREVAEAVAPLDEPLPQAPDVDHEFEVFTHLMEMAHAIHRQDATGLARLVSAIMGPLQADHLLSVAERVQHAAIEAASLERLFSPDYFFSYFDPMDCIQLRPENHRVDLSRDIVLSTPWTRSCFANALANIGTDRNSGAWRQDPNHRVTLVLPWRFGIVTNGNHSIAAGILGREGFLTPSNVLDLSPLLTRVRCDGRHFVQGDSGEILARTQSGRTAALFEIGRLMPIRPADRS